MLESIKKLLTYDDIVSKIFAHLAFMNTNMKN